MLFNKHVHIPVPFESSNTHSVPVPSDSRVKRVNVTVVDGVETVSIVIEPRPVVTEVLLSEEIERF